MFVCPVNFRPFQTVRSDESASGIISTISTAGREQPDFSAAQKASKVTPALLCPRKGSCEMTATGTAREESQSMEFSVTKSALLNELNTTQGVVERKTTIPILSNLLVEAKGSRVTITATDLELSVRTSCEAKIKKEGAGQFQRRSSWNSCDFCRKAKSNSSCWKITGSRS